MEQDKHHLRRQLEETKREIHQLNDIRTLRLKEIGRREPDTMAAVEWLSKNKEKFKRQIFEPIISTVNAADSKYTKMVEASIWHKEKFAFVAQDSEVSS